MLKFKDGGTSQVLVGLNRVGIVGLGGALREAAESGLTEREAIIDLLMDKLQASNYIPDRHNETYRTTLWREYLRYRGEDIRPFFSEIAVTVRGEEGEKRGELAKVLESVLAEFELKPVITYAPGGEGQADLELAIFGETILRGFQGGRQLKEAVHKTISGW